MFDIVRNNQKIVQVILALIAVPFAFFGVDSFMRSSGVGQSIALVGDTKISQSEFQHAWAQYQDRLREMRGPNFNLQASDTPEARMSVLNTLIDQRLLALEVANKRLMPSASALQEVISSQSAFQDESGKFSMERYQAYLTNQKQSPQMFEAELGRDLSKQYLTGVIAGAQIVPETTVNELYRLRSEERQIAEFRLKPTDYAKKVNIAPEAVQQYYDNNHGEFEVPERVKVEYLLLSANEIAKQIKVTDAELEEWYKSAVETKRFTEPEKRRASHILVSLDAKATDADKAAAKTKAEEVLAQVNKPGADFAKLSKQYSQDPGSAVNGGDLGFFGRGAMVPPFEEAVFKMKEGEISGLVQSNFGYHIIKLTGIQPERTRPLVEVRGEGEQELKRQAGLRKFAEVSSKFGDTVYDQADSLKPAEELVAPLGVKVRQSDWLIRKPQAAQAAALGPLGNEKFLTAVFSDEAIKNKRNTDAIDVGANDLLAAHVIEHEPAAQKPFEDIKAGILQKLTAKEEQSLAKQDGDARLAQLKEGKDQVAWTLVKSVSRADGRAVPSDALQAIFKADVKNLPAYVGVEMQNNGGYALYKIMKVGQPEKANENLQKSVESELGRITAQEDMAAFMAALRSRYKIEINKPLLEAKDR